MWLKDLGELYVEGWGPGSPNLPVNAKGVPRAQETHDSIRMKGIFGSGDSPSNMAAVSQAGGIEFNPVEQEEDKALSKSKVLGLIDSSMATLDSKNNSDKTALLIMGILRKQINRL